MSGVPYQSLDLRLFTSHFIRLVEESKRILGSS